MFLTHMLRFRTQVETIFYLDFLTENYANYLPMLGKKCTPSYISIYIFPNTDMQVLIDVKKSTIFEIETVLVPNECASRLIFVYFQVLLKTIRVLRIC